MPDQSNVLNVPCDRCGVGWMVVTPEQRWRVAWRSHATGFTSHGEGVFETQAAAQTVCDDANQRWPDLDHWTESLEHLELHCSNTPRCQATQPLPAYIAVRRAGINTLPGFEA